MLLIFNQLHWYNNNPHLFKFWLKVDVCFYCQPGFTVIVIAPLLCYIQLSQVAGLSSVWGRSRIECITMSAKGVQPTALIIQRCTYFQSLAERRCFFLVSTWLTVIAPLFCYNYFKWPARPQYVRLTLLCILGGSAKQCITKSAKVWARVKQRCWHEITWCESRV